MSRIFDTDVQSLKHKVLTAIAKSAYHDTLVEDCYAIPKQIIPGPKPTCRCCIYKERAIVQERIALALGGDKNIKNVVEVIKIACDECPVSGYYVSDRCRGCIAHNCQKACHKGAISFSSTTRQAIIDKTKCINCGMCAKACQYNAILNNQRPCEMACKVKAISMGEDLAATIDDEKCIHCGACVYTCPFGAIMDKSYITDVIKVLRANKKNNQSNVYAIVAPSIASSYKTSSIGKVVSAIKALGFHAIVEAALGADMVSYHEARELHEKKLLTSSCCPAFVDLIKKNYPSLTNVMSSSLSPMATIGKYIKENDPKAITVFIGPCVAKKAEALKEEVKPYINFVLTFEELEAMFDAKEIDINVLEESSLDNASYFGRIFARSGGLSTSISQSLKEQNIDFEVKGVVGDGVDNCKLLLNKIKNPQSDINFVEGMACPNGCIGGPCSLSHSLVDKNVIDRYGKESKEQTIKDAISSFIDEE